MYDVHVALNFWDFVRVFQSCKIKPHISSKWKIPDDPLLYNKDVHMSVQCKIVCVFISDDLIRGLKERLLSKIS